MAWTPGDAQKVTEVSSAWVPTDAVWTPEDAVTKRDTTVAEDFGIGLGNAASTVVKGVGLLSGGAASLFDTDVGDAIFKGTNELAKSTTDYWTPADAKQSFGGKLTSMVSTLPAQLLAMPFSPADTGISMLDTGETVGKAQMGSLLDTVGNVVGMALPGAMGGSLLKRTVSGAGINASQDALVRKAISDTADQQQTKENFAPTLETTALAGVLGGGIGALSKGGSKTKSEGKPTDVSPLDEQQLMQETHSSIGRELDKAQDSLDGLTRVIESLGEAAPDTLRAEHAAAEVNVTKLTSDMADLEARIAGDTTRVDTADQALARDIRLKELTTRLKEERAVRQEHNRTYLEDNISKVEDKIDGIKKSMENRNETSEAAQQAVANKLAEIDRLTTQLDGLKRQRTPKETAPVKEAEQPPVREKEVPTHEEVITLVGDSATVGEVFTRIKEANVGTKGQKALLAILDRIPHITNAAFRIGEAMVEGDKSSSGSYTKLGNTVELHAGGKLNTILHEAVHAATVHLLDDGKNVHAIALNALYNSLKDYKGSNHYGFTNAKEMVAEAMTNPRFQQFLQSIELPKSTFDKKPLTMWDKFKNIIKDAISYNKEVRTALDDALDHGGALIEVAKRTSENTFQKLSEKQSGEVSYNKVDLNPLPLITRNYFGMNALAKLYGHIPQVKAAYTHIRTAVESAKKLENSWLNDTSTVLAGKMSFMDTMRNVADKASAKIAIIKTSDADMSILHDLFHKGFTNRLDYATNLARHGQHLSLELTKTYNKLTELFGRMYDDTEALQQGLGKTSQKLRRAGWYPAKREGNWAVEIGFNGTLGRVQTFPTKHAADMFREQIGNTNHVTVSEALDTRNPPAETNRTMAEIIGDKLAKDYPNLSGHIQASIDNLMRTMEAKGGKLGQHHKFRTNIPGYRGTELFYSPEKQGHSFKRGILGEVENFGANARGLMIKHNLDPIINDAQFKQDNPRGHAVVQTMYEKSMGRIDNAASKFDDGLFNITDKLTNTIMQGAFKKAFKGEEGSALGQAGGVLMPVFYASKVFAKATFAIAQALTTSFVIPELAKGHNTPRAFYSFGKGMINLVSHNKELMESLKRVSQEFGTFSPQVRESLNIERNSQIDHSLVKKTGKFILDYPLLMKLGELGDSGSRVIAYAAAFTHFRDLGMAKAEAEAKAREVAGTTMTEYGTMGPGAVYDRLGAMGQGAKPLTTFATNQLGNFIHYADLFRKGDTGPILSYVALAIMTGGALSLPLIADYETLRQLAMKFGNITMPSVLELLRTDNTFLDRLTNTPNFTNDALLMGPISGVTEMDLTGSMRGNATPVLIAAQIAMGMEDFAKMYPIAASSLGMAVAVPKVVQSALGEAGVVDPTGVREGGKAIDSLVSGHFNYAAKELLNKRQSKVFGENTGMVARGAKGDAVLEDSPKAKLASALGGRLTSQTYNDRVEYEQSLKTKSRQAQIESAGNMFTETGDSKYLNKMIELGMTDKEIKNKLDTDVYNKVVEAEIRAIRNKGGTINKTAAINRIPFMRNKE